MRAKVMHSIIDFKRTNERHSPLLASNISPTFTAQRECA